LDIAPDPERSEAGVAPGVGRALLDVAVAGLLVAAYVLAPRDSFALLRQMGARVVAVAAPVDEAPPPPAPPPPPPREAIVVVEPPASLPPIAVPPIVMAMRAPAQVVEREPPVARRGHQTARASFVASAPRQRASSVPREKPEKRKEEEASAPPPRPKPTNALDSAIRDAAGPTAASAPSPDAVPSVSASSSTPTSDGTRPDRPSGSAVASAITQVLPAARACLGDVPDPSRATITFGPEGAVQKVDITGPAASSSKVMPCLRSALGRAHVPPFAQSSYAASVTVRPL